MTPADPRDVLTRSADPPDAVLRWADPETHGEDGVADVYLPEVSGTYERAPVIVALHGGFWRREYDRRGLRPLAVALRALDRVVVLPEYRRHSGEPRGEPSGGPSGGPGGGPSGGNRSHGWQATADDVRALRQRLPGLLAEVTGRADDGPPTVLGHSAGGHLALWWALDAAQGEVPGRVVALAPVADLARADADGLGSGAVADLLGGPPGHRPDEYAIADVAARLRAGERPGCPLVVVQGGDDRQVPATHAQGLVGVDLRLLPGVEHFGLIDPRSQAWPEVVASLA